MSWDWEKAATLEHVHRVMKDEIGSRVMPSGRFGTTAVWFRSEPLTFDVFNPQAAGAA